MRKYLLPFIFFCFQQICWGQQTLLVGVTTNGGNGFGTIFHYNTGDTALSYVYKLTGTPGSSPQFNSLTLESNGKILGMTSYGGVFGQGIIFEYNTSTNSYTSKADMDFKNAVPIGGLTLASNGKYYGCSSLGIFEFDYSSNTVTAKKTFVANSTSTGSNPSGSMVLASNGKLYGMNGYGGTNNGGVIFEYDFSTNTYTKKINFSSTGGSNPKGDLLLATNGKLYGLTTTGGTNNKGVLFQYDNTTNSYTKLYDFGGANGETPYGKLIQATNGKLYGITYAGGGGSVGVIFQYDISSSTFAKLTDVISFAGNSYGSLLQASNGKIYGTSYTNGHSVGVLFDYDYTSNVGNIDFSFWNASGQYPYGGNMIQASNGKIYGMTNQGGNAGDGVLFEYDVASGTYTKRVDFGATNGEYIKSNLLNGGNGNLYGNTRNGGYYSAGTIFSYNVNSKTYTKLFAVGDSVYGKGRNLENNLSLSSNNSFYGMATDGGTFGVGLIYQYNFSSNTFSNLYNFGYGSTDGYLPYTSKLTLANNGKYYGVTTSGGAFGNGIIFEYDQSSSTYSDVYDFGFNDLKQPWCELTLANNGKLYGITQSGGSGYGGIFEFNPATNSYTDKFNFSGASPYPYNTIACPFLQAKNGKLYCAATQGGWHGYGDIVEYDYNANTLSNKFSNFLDSIGERPNGKIIEACNGKIYGVTAVGGDYKCGTLYEYDYTNNSFTKKLSFKLQDGISPYSLTEYLFPPVTPALQAFNNSICIGDSSIIKIISGSLGSATHWQWYKGNCTTGTAIDTGVSIKVKPLVTTTYSVRSEGGCVPVGICVSVTIIVRPVSYATMNKTICDNHPFYFNGHNLNISGTYYDTLLNYVGCDSFVTLHLTVLPTSSYSFNQTVCYNHPYNFNGTLLNISGIYHNTIPNHFGCDSFITLNLAVKPISNYSFSQTICSNHPYYFKNHWLNTSGLYKDTLSNYVGCDSFVTLNLTVHPISNYSFTHKICSYQFYNFNNHNLNVSGTYLDTLVNHVGCDSFLTLHLIVLPDSVLRTKYICPGSPYNFNGTLITVPGTYRDSLTNQLGCDSIVVLHLFNGFTTTSNITAIVCFNHPFQVGTKFYNQTGTYHDTIPNRLQCDSFVALHLTVKPISSYAFSKTICKNNPFYFHQQWLNVSGIYHDTLINFVGCDSFVTLHLTVKDTSLVILVESICNDHSYFFHHHYLNQTGSYHDTLQNYLGCDSTVILHLQVNISSSSNVTESVCSNRPYHFNHLYLDSSGIFHDTIPNYSGCDSTITLNLTMYPEHPRVTNVLGKLTAFGSGYDHLYWMNCYTKSFVSSANPYDVNESGNYAVVVTQGNCSDTSACINVDISCYLEATPNPAKDEMTIKIKCGDKAFHVLLTDVLGRTLMYDEIENVGQFTLYRNRLPSGIYFLYLSNKHFVEMVKKVMWE